MSMNLQYIVRESFLGLRRTRVATFVTVTTVAITLFLLGIFLMLTLNVGQFIGVFQDKMRIEAFIDGSLNDTAVREIHDRLNACSGISRLEYVSPEMALEQFRNELGDDPLDILGENPLPASFRIYLESDYRSPERASVVVECVRSCPGVADVIYHGRLFQLMHQYKRALFAGTFILFGIVLISALFLVSNTLRLTIYAQREKIEIMDLIGASPAFIRRPYLIQGLLQGLIGGSIGTILLWILSRIIELRFPALLNTSDWFFSFPLILGMILGYFGSVFGIRRFLNKA